MKNSTLFILLLIGIYSCTIQEDKMKNRKKLSEQYFSAFHKGKLDEVNSYFNENATIQYGEEEPTSAKIFFPQSAELIASLEFITHGIYVSENTDNIIIHFGYYPKSDKSAITEAIDIIEFDENDKITKIRVIPYN